MCSELSWPLDIAPNAHNIGLLAIQTSTPRDPNSVPPPLKTPATDFNPYVRPSAVDEQPQLWHYQRNEAAESKNLPEAHPNQFTPQPHGWSDEHNEQDTVRPADFDGEDDDKTQYLCVDDEGHEQFANAIGYDVDQQSRYPGGQTVVDQAQAQPMYNGPVEHELQDQMFAFTQPQQNEYGHMFPGHHWDQQMYELQCEDVTDAGQLEMADSRNYYLTDMQNHSYTNEQRGMNAGIQSQWSATATLPQLVSNVAQSNYVSVATSAAFENGMLSTWPPAMHAKAAAPSKEASIWSSADNGDGDFGGYRVQYKQPEMDHFQAVSAAGDGPQALTVAKHIDSKTTAVAKTVPERLQQAFLQPGKFLMAAAMHLIWSYNFLHFW